jgi:hypothetical protein
MTLADSRSGLQKLLFLLLLLTLGYLLEIIFKQLGHIKNDLVTPLFVTANMTKKTLYNHVVKANLFDN